MILKALAQYYQRLADDPDIDIAPPGFERKPIDFLIVIDAAGNFVNLRELREGTGRKRKGRVSLVPKGVKRSSGIAANLLWDTPPYVLGKALPDKKKNFTKLSQRAAQQHNAFIQRINDTFSTTDDDGIKAIQSFLQKGDFEPVFSHDVWNEVEESGGNISFALKGETNLICQRPEVISQIMEQNETSRDTQTCSVSGQEDVPAELHTAIKGVWGAQSSGANIVSFNLGAFRSFGKKQGMNAPVGKTVEFAYTTALNYLLASEKQRMQFGDASTVFWSKNPCDLEKDFASYLGLSSKGEEAASYDKIRSLLSAVKTGIPPEEAELPFYVLGLAPNASRIAIRFWYEGNVKDIKERISQHFEDMEIIRAPHDPEYLSLFKLLLSTATEHKSDNIPPNLSGEVARSILMETNYPRTLFANSDSIFKSNNFLVHDLSRCSVS